MKSVGIDIGSSQIKVVEIQAGSKGLALTHYLIHPFSTRANNDPLIETIEFLRDLAGKYDPTQTTFSVCLRQDQVAVRNKLFPFNDRLKILKTLPMELDEDIPFTMEDSVYDAKIVCYRGPQAEVLACAAPKAHLEKLLGIFKEGGIEPDIVSSEGVAFANIFEKWNEPPPMEAANKIDLEESEVPERDIHIVLNFGHSRTLVCAFEKNQLIGLRSISWGARQIADAISRKYELPIAEAQKEMELKGFILTTPQEGHFEAKIFSDTIAKAVRELLRDLQLTLLEFKSEFKANVTRVDITGGLAHIQGLGPFMTQVLEVPVNRIQILDRFTNVLFERTDVTDSRLGLAIGLAIEGLKKPRNPALNFLRGTYAKKNSQLEAILNRWSLAGKVALASFLVLIVWSFIREDLAVTLVDVSMETLKGMGKTVAGLSNSQNSESGIRKHIIEKKKTVSELRSLAQIAPMNSALEIFKKINDNIPAKASLKLDVKRLSIEDSRVLVEGYLGSAREVSVLQQALSQVANDGKVISQSSRLGPKPGRTSFAFYLNVDRGVIQK